MCAADNGDAGDNGLNGVNGFDGLVNFFCFHRREQSGTAALFFFVLFHFMSKVI